MLISHKHWKAYLLRVSKIIKINYFDYGSAVDMWFFVPISSATDVDASGHFLGLDSAAQSTTTELYSRYNEFVIQYIEFYEQYCWG